jgi:hypothetical protein
VGRNGSGSQSVTNFWSRGVRNFKVYNPLWPMAGPKTSDEALQLLIDDMWGTDPVHPSQTGYCKLLAALEPQAKSLRLSGDPTASPSRSPEGGGMPEWLPTHPLGHSPWDGVRGSSRRGWLRPSNWGRSHGPGHRGQGAGKTVAILL